MHLSAAIRPVRQPNLTHAHHNHLSNIFIAALFTFWCIFTWNVILRSEIIFLVNFVSKRGHKLYVIICWCTPNQPLLPVSCTERKRNRMICVHQLANCDVFLCCSAQFAKPHQQRNAIYIGCRFDPIIANANFCAFFRVLLSSSFLLNY